MAYKTKFMPKNVDRYQGDYNKIICRSSWERYFANYLDTNQKIKWWLSEGFIIPYLSPVDKKIHRYFTDFMFEMIDGRVIVVEIKPYSQCIPPIHPKRKTKKSTFRYINAVKAYYINQAKWAAARKVCKEKGYIFEIFTENSLKKLGAPL